MKGSELGEFVANCILLLWRLCVLTVRGLYLFAKGVARFHRFSRTQSRDE